MLSFNKSSEAVLELILSIDDTELLVFFRCRTVLHTYSK